MISHIRIHQYVCKFHVLLRLDAGGGNVGGTAAAAAVAATYDYGYGRPAQTYDSSKTFYQQSSAYGSKTKVRFFFHLNISLTLSRCLVCSLKSIVFVVTLFEFQFISFKRSFSEQIVHQPRNWCPHYHSFLVRCVFVVFERERERKQYFCPLLTLVSSPFSLSLLCVF